MGALLRRRSTRRRVQGCKGHTQCCRTERETALPQAYKVTPMGCSPHRGTYRCQRRAKGHGGAAEAEAEACTWLQRAQIEHQPSHCTYDTREHLYGMTITNSSRNVTRSLSHHFLPCPHSPHPHKHNAYQVRTPSSGLVAAACIGLQRAIIERDLGIHRCQPPSSSPLPHAQTDRTRDRHGVLGPIHRRCAIRRGGTQALEHRACLEEETRRASHDTIPALGMPYCG